jgi:hypothetical protein
MAETSKRPPYFRSQNHTTQHATHSPRNGLNHRNNTMHRTEKTSASIRQLTALNWHSLLICMLLAHVPYRSAAFTPQSPTAVNSPYAVDYVLLPSGASQSKARQQEANERAEVRVSQSEQQPRRRLYDLGIGKNQPVGRSVATTFHASQIGATHRENPYFLSWVDHESVQQYPSPLPVREKGSSLSANPLNAEFGKKKNLPVIQLNRSYRDSLPIFESSTRGSDAEEVLRLPEHGAPRYGDVQAWSKAPTMVVRSRGEYELDTIWIEMMIHDLQRSKSGQSMINSAIPVAA